MKRQKPLWDYRIAPALRAGSNVLVIAHSNSLRGLAKIIDNIDDNDIEDIGFPPGIPVVYKFERDITHHNNNLLKPKRPDQGSLVQEHTSGIFLEKPGLLKEALLRQTEWQTSVPGTNGIELSPMVKRMTTMEKSLLLLKQEQKLEQWAASQQHPPTYNIPGITHVEHLRSGIIPAALDTPDTTIKLVSTANNNEGNTDDDDIGDFEEPSHTDSITSLVHVVANVARDADLEDGPVVVLVRHGTTPHNELGLFTGWEDPPLSEAGVEDAKRAGKLLKSHGFVFDVVYTSWLSRAIETAWYICDELDMKWLPLVKSWRLNERH
jgi:bisphosphoglycerate-dependent phosphoglycerate mutase